MTRENHTASNSESRKRLNEASTSTEPFDASDAITIAKYGTPVPQDATSATETATGSDCSTSVAPELQACNSGPQISAEERKALRVYASSGCNQFDAKRILRLLDALETAEQRLTQPSKTGILCSSCEQRFLPGLESVA